MAKQFTAATDPVNLVQKLNKTGLDILKLVVGVMLMTTEGNWFGSNGDVDANLELLYKCYQSGLRTFDTADTYSNGKSEELLGMFLKKYKIPRQNVVIMTKGYFPVLDDVNDSSGLSNDADALKIMNRKGLSRKHILEAAKASYDRLGTYADIYQIHRYDPNVSNEEIMKALNDVVEKGYATYIGASSMKTYEFIDLQYTAKLNGWHQFVSMQSYYNLLYRNDEHELNPWCKKHDIALFPWSPNARGLLAVPWDSEVAKTKLQNEFMNRILGISPSSESDREIAKRLELLAEKKKGSMMQVALAWLLVKGANPIVGISKLEYVDEVAGVVDVELTEEDIKYLEEPYVTKANVPLLD